MVSLLFFFFSFVHSFVDTTPDPYYTQICVLCASADTLIHAFLVERMFASVGKKWNKKNEMFFFPFVLSALNKFVFHSISNKGATKKLLFSTWSFVVYVFIERKKNIMERTLNLLFFCRLRINEFYFRFWNFIFSFGEDGAFNKRRFIESHAEQRGHMFPNPNWTTVQIRIGFILKSIDQHLMNKFHEKNP